MPGDLYKFKAACSSISFELSSQTKNVEKLSSFIKSLTFLYVLSFDTICGVCKICAWAVLTLITYLT